MSLFSTQFSPSRNTLPIMEDPDTMGSVELENWGSKNGSADASRCAWKQDGTLYQGLPPHLSARYFTCQHGLPISRVSLSSEQDPPAVTKL